jgi:hypothetical protein
MRHPVCKKPLPHCSQLGGDGLGGTSAVSAAMIVVDQSATHQVPRGISQSQGLQQSSNYTIEKKTLKELIL